MLFVHLTPNKKQNVPWRKNELGKLIMYPQPTPPLPDDAPNFFDDEPQPRSLFVPPSIDAFLRVNANQLHQRFFRLIASNWRSNRKRFPGIDQQLMYVALDVNPFPEFWTFHSQRHATLFRFGAIEHGNTVLNNIWVSFPLGNPGADRSWCVQPGFLDVSLRTIPEANVIVMQTSPTLRRNGLWAVYQHKNDTSLYLLLGIYTRAVYGFGRRTARSVEQIPSFPLFPYPGVFTEYPTNGDWQPNEFDIVAYQDYLVSPDTLIYDADPNQMLYMRTSFVFEIWNEPLPLADLPQATQERVEMAPILPGPPPSRRVENTVYVGFGMAALFFLFTIFLLLFSSNKNHWYADANAWFWLRVPRRAPKSDQRP